jgi:hypothetical protein
MPPVNAYNYRNIETDNDNRPISPDMLVYSSDQVDKTPKASTSQHLPPVALTPPPAPPVTETGAPSGLLDQIRQGKKLKKIETVISDSGEKGKVLFEKEEFPRAESSNTGMLDHLRNKLDSLRPMLTGDEDLEENTSNDN